MPALHHSAPCHPPGYWLVLQYGTWRPSCMWTHIIYVQYTHKQGQSRDSSSKCLTRWALCLVMFTGAWLTHKISSRGQHARHLSNCHIHFLPPVSGVKTSNNAVRTHKTQTPKREGRSSFVLFLEWVLWNLKKGRDRDGSTIHIPDEWK